ncbi:hypothetical protein HPP92_023241 [Vanilla planifolia]|uniref:Uncharacterized protein n=1 Tax=Vanilla planifolia TaxID=51239 RepID=A0A835PZW4_VANPL|nr:hypothetical protein HPP92_023241 [Vanilla planifolia]
MRNREDLCVARVVSFSVDVIDDVTLRQRKARCSRVAELDMQCEPTKLHFVAAHLRCLTLMTKAIDNNGHPSDSQPLKPVSSFSSQHLSLGCHSAGSGSTGCCCTVEEVHPQAMWVSRCERKLAPTPPRRCRSSMKVMEESNQDSRSS